MIRKIKWFKVDSAPLIWQPDSIYIIEDGDYGEGYVTDINGIPKELGNSVMINNLIAVALATTGSDLYSGTAGESISGGSLVYINGGKFYKYDASNAGLANQAFGMAKTAALINNPITIQVNGIFNEVGLGVTTGTVYYAGLAGAITTSTSNLVVTQIGIGIDANNLNLDIQPSILTV